MLVTIITASKDAALTIDGCLDSIAAQTHDSIQHILVDGLSTDATCEIAASHSSPPAMIVSAADTGIYDALNKGLCLAKGDLVGFLGADDRLAEPKTIAKICGAVQAASADCCYGGVRFVDASGRVRRHWRTWSVLPRRFGWGWMPHHLTFYCRRNFYDHVRFDTGLRIAADYKCMSDIFIRHNPIVARLDCDVVLQRLGGISNRSAASILLKMREDYRVARDMRAPLPSLTVMLKNLRKLGQLVLTPNERSSDLRGVLPEDRIGLS